MTETTHTLTATRVSQASPEQRRLTYRLFRTPGHYGKGRSKGQLYQLPAWKAWELVRRYESASLARRYAEALS